MPRPGRTFQYFPPRAGRQLCAQYVLFCYIHAQTCPFFPRHHLKILLIRPTMGPRRPTPPRPTVRLAHPGARFADCVRQQHVREFVRTFLRVCRYRRWSFPTDLPRQHQHVNQFCPITGPKFCSDMPRHSGARANRPGRHSPNARTGMDSWPRLIENAPDMSRYVVRAQP